MTDPRPPRAADPLDLDRRRDQIASRLFGARPREATTIGRYTVLRRLGAGGMAVVYAAYDESLDRRVALKLLQRADVESESLRQARLEREAKSMARLSHPHVATVYEIGTHAPDDGEPLTFIAIEYVDGQDLRKWLGEAKPATDRLALLRQAALGLAAAHEAGLVHRDFKPENVMVRNDGVVKVVDFGVAAWLESTSPQIEEAAATPADDVSLTVTGRVPGTPAYMAPEQLQGQAADARSDQYSFCVTAYEALVGERPFRGATVAALLESMREGLAATPSEVPRAVLSALTRGLAFSPDARFASMDALLRAMASDPRRRLRRAFTAVAALGIVGAGGFALARLDVDEPCREGMQRVDAAWTDDRQAEIRDAFTRTELPFATSAWEQTRDGLDDWARRWGAMRDEACRATQVHGTQSEDLLDRRMACLDRAWASFRTTLDVLADADADTVTDAPPRAAEPFRLEACADSQALLEGTPLPVEPERREAVEQADEAIATLQAELGLGRGQDSSEAAARLVEQAEATDHPPVVARALYAAGLAQRSGGEESSAARTLRRALKEAQAAGDSELFVRAALTLSGVLTNGHDEHEEALDILELADGTLRHAGDPDELRGRWHTARGVVLRRAGRYADSEAAYRRGLERFTGDDAGSARERARIRAALGILAKDLGRTEEALEVLTEVQEGYVRTLGKEHPSVCRGLNQIASIHMAMRQWHEAKGLLERSLECFRVLHGPDHIALAAPLGNYGTALFGLGELDEAEPLLEQQLVILRANRGEGSSDEVYPLDTLSKINRSRGKLERAHELLTRGIEITEQRRGPTARPLAFALYGRAEISAQRGDMDAAEADAKRVTEILEANEMQDHVLGPATHFILGAVARARGDQAGTLAAFREALRRYEVIHGDEPHVDIATALGFVGNAEAALDHDAQARASFERALEILQHTPAGANPHANGSAHYGLAQLLWESPGERPLALEHARAALTFYETLKDERVQRIIGTWIAERE